MVTITLAPGKVGPTEKKLVFCVKRGRGESLVVQGEGTFDEMEEYNAVLAEL